MPSQSTVCSCSMRHLNWKTKQKAVLCRHFFRSRIEIADSVGHANATHQIKYRLYSARRPVSIEQWRMGIELRNQGTQYELNRFKRHEEIMTNNIIIELIECLVNFYLLIDSVTATNKVLMSSRNGQFPVISFLCWGTLISVNLFTADMTLRLLLARQNSLEELTKKLNWNVFIRCLRNATSACTMTIF